MKILFFSRGYGNMAGGIEKMSLDLAKGLSEAGHKVTIISLDQEDSNSFFTWPINVEWKKLGIGKIDTKNSIFTRVKRIRAIRRIAKQQNFDVAVGFQVGAFALLRISLIFTSTRVVAAERNAPTLFNYIHFGNLKRFFANIILASADKIAIQFEDYKIYYPKHLHSRLKVTPNWVKSPISIKPFKEKENVNLLFIGRLTFQKNVEVLIRAMSLLPHYFNLTIIGSGPDKDFLVQLCQNLNLANIKFSDPTKNVSSEFLNADIFCLPSRWEGFPNVIAEALAHGVPCVGFSECSGIQQLLIPGTNGFVASGNNNPSTLSAAILDASKIKFSSSDVAKTVGKYSFSNYLKCWECALS